MKFPHCLVVKSDRVWEDAVCFDKNRQLDNKGA